ncbi:hypothetical protein FOA52_014453 [Chlamydomonas sp. UWO 241]|nr:hypothetical protein FOA52_014453 [Chlamydomonas sp. UWO 241]
MEERWSGEMERTGDITPCDTMPPSHQTTHIHSNRWPVHYYMADSTPPRRLTGGGSEDGTQLSAAKATLMAAEVERKYKDEVKWLKKQHLHVEEELERKKKRMVEAEEELERLRKTTDAMQPTIDELRAEAEELRSRLERRDTAGAGHTGDLIAARAEAEAAARATEGARAEASSATRASHAATQRAERAEADARACAEREAAARAEADAAAAEAGTLRSQLEEACTEAANAEAARATAVAAAEAAVAEVSGLRARVVEVEAGASRARADAKLVDARVTRAAEDKAAAKVELAAAVARAQALEDELRQSTDAMSEDKMRARMERMERELLGLNESYSKVNYEYAKAKAELTIAVGRAVRMETELTGLRTMRRDLSHAASQGGAGALARMVALLEVGPTCEAPPEELAGEDSGGGTRRH